MWTNCKMERVEGQTEKSLLMTNNFELEKKQGCE
jgi:hypothetical protein